MVEPLLGAVTGYAIGSVPVAWIAGRVAGGVDLRERGSGNVGASNVWQSVSKWLVVPVGVAQIAQGLLAVLCARALGGGDGGEALAGVAAVVASDWNPWLGFMGGRGIGATIGVMLGISWPALGAFTAVALVGVALRANPQGVAAGLLAAPIASAVAGEAGATVAASIALAAIALVKRLFANGRPVAEAQRPGVWWTRLLYDRDITDRDAWVRRRVDEGGDARPWYRRRSAQPPR